MDTLYKLVEIDGGEEHELNTTNILIGRDKAADIVLRHGYPSRHHAQITIENESIVIEDLNSTNGTFINNSRLHKPSPLQEGDVIQFDSVSYHLVRLDKQNSTVIMQHLKPVNAQEEQSSVVVIGGFSNTDETAIREAYSLPPSWSMKDLNALANTEEENRYSSKVIDGIITNNLPDKERFSAAIVVTSGKHESTIVGLSITTDQQQWLIGRANSNSIQLTDISISSIHACLFYNRGRWGISDENSKNGTQVNDHSTNEIQLNNNDRIELGQVSMIFRRLKN